MNPCMDYDDDHYTLADGQACPRCGFIEEIHVACDINCNALKAPQTLADALNAVSHWRDHRLTGGCSHAR